MAKCQHGAFVTTTQVRMMRHTPLGPVVQYVLEADIACYDCGMKFELTRIPLKETRQYLRGVDAKEKKVADA